MERIVKIEPAYDGRPKFGRHGVAMRFVLKGELGAVQFLLWTGWQLDGTVSQMMAADRGYHSPTPRYDGQGIISDACEFLDGKPCYYDGSSSAADDVFASMVKEGDAGMWANLEEYYRQTFGELR